MTDRDGMTRQAARVWSPGDDARAVARAGVVGCVCIILGVLVRGVGGFAVDLRRLSCCDCSQCYPLFIEGPDADALHGFPAGLVKGVGMLVVVAGVALGVPAAFRWLCAQVAGVLAELSHRPIDPMVCPHCRYDLTGLPAGSRCPECGFVG